MPSTDHGSVEESEKKRCNYYDVDTTFTERLRHLGLISHKDHSPQSTVAPRLKLMSLSSILFIWVSQLNSLPRAVLGSYGNKVTQIS